MRAVMRAVGAEARARAPRRGRRPSRAEARVSPPIRETLALLGACHRLVARAGGGRAGGLLVVGAVAPPDRARVLDLVEAVLRRRRLDGHVGAFGNDVKNVVRGRRT